MRPKHVLLFLIFSLLFVGMSDYLSAYSQSYQFYLKDGKLPKSFRTSPAKTSNYLPLKVIHNPAEDIYVVFTVEYDSKVKKILVYSRAYNHKGKPKGPFFKILPIITVYKDFAPSTYVISHADVCYNSTENKFFFIWTYDDYDAIWGIELNARGNREGVSTYTYLMKKQLNKRASGLYPRIVWMPEQNQYAMSLTSLDIGSSNPNSPKNGYYLSTYTPFLTPKKNMKKVRSIRIINGVYLLSEFMVAGNKLLWGTVESINEKWKKPVVWLTKSNGKNLTSDWFFDTGVKYPGKKVRYGGDVRAAYDPNNDIFLLTWNAYAESLPSNRTFHENYYRIMDGDGNFIGKEQKLPQVENFQLAADVTFDQADNHFFLICSEYKILGEPFSYAPSLSPLLDTKSFWGGKIWGYKVDGQGKQLGSSIPLTKVFTDVDTSMHFNGATYNTSDDQHFFIYYVQKLAEYTSKTYGGIYK